MQRTTSANNVAAPPAYAAGPNAAGFFANGPPGTVVDADDLNGLQEEIAAVIEAVGGLTLSGADNSQLSQVVGHVRGLRSNASDTGVAASPHLRVLVAASGSRANGAATAVLGATNSTATAPPSVVLGSDNCSTTGAGPAAVIASQTGSVASGAAAAVLAGNASTASGIQATVIGAVGAAASSTRSTVIGSSGAPVAAALESAILASEDSLGTDACRTEAAHSAVVASDRSQTRAAAGQEHQIVEASFDSQTRGNRVAASASTGADVDGTQCAVVASELCTIGSSATEVLIAASDATVEANGAERSAAIATRGCSLAADAQAFLAACDSTTASGAAGSTEVAAIGCLSSEVGALADRCVLLASERVLVAVGDADSVVGGFAVSGAAATANKTWALRSNGGVGVFEGGTSAGPADYAEFFEALDGEVPVGSLVGLVGDRVRAARQDDPVIGVVSAAPSLLGNAAPLSWHGRYARDEFGRSIRREVEIVEWEEWVEEIVAEVPWIAWAAVESEGDDPGREAYDGPEGEAFAPIPVDAERSIRRFARAAEDGRPLRRVVRSGYAGPLDGAPVPVPADARRRRKVVRVESPDFDPTRLYVPRDARPSEWCAVGLVGQLRTRVDKRVGVGDWIISSALAGVGTSSAAGGRAIPADGSRICCLRIEVPYEVSRGYGIALCLVR